MIAIRQELRRVLCGCCAFSFGNGRDVASRGGRAHQAGRCAEENGSLLAPRPPETTRRIAEYLHRAIRQIHPLELVFGKECDEAAVGRPKWAASAVGSR